MDIRHLTPNYAVSPQIEPSDCAALAEAGFTTLICNRPDMEVPPPLQASAMRAAAEAAGLSFVDNPVFGASLSPENVEIQSTTLAEATGPVFAYCRSGTRCTIVWAFGAAATTPVDQITQAASQAGYDLSGMASQLAMMSKG